MVGIWGSKWFRTFDIVSPVGYSIIKKRGSDFMSESSSYFDLAGRLEESFAEIEDAITVDLRENNEDYRSLFQSISDLKVKNPFIQNVIEGTGELALSAEEHEILADYFKL